MRPWPVAAGAEGEDPGHLHPGGERRCGRRPLHVPGHAADALVLPDPQEVHRGERRKSIGIIYTEATPTLQDIGTETLPDIAKELGIEVTTSVGHSGNRRTTLRDLPGARHRPGPRVDPARRCVQPDRDDAAAPGRLHRPRDRQLRCDCRQPRARGRRRQRHGLARRLQLQQSAASSQQFVKDYTDEFGEDPLNYAAEAYDAAWFLARSIKNAEDASRDSIKDAMATLAGESLDGALGSV